MRTHIHTHEDCWKEKEQGGTDIQGLSVARLKRACGLLRWWDPLTTYLWFSSINASTVACTERTDAGWA